MRSLQSDKIITILWYISNNNVFGVSNQDYLLRTSIAIMHENGFKLAMERSRIYPTQTITDTDYANVMVLLANTPAQVKTLLHGLERAAASIGLHINEGKTENMCFNQRGYISTLNCSFWN